ncbi:MAG: MDR family MFS transporter [Acidimicrobiia bacterium]
MSEERVQVRGGEGTERRRILITFSGLMAGMFLAALDQTVVATALPTIAGELGDLEKLSWVVTSYLLTSTATTPLYGKLSDLYGRRPLYQAAIAIFLVGSVLSGLARDMPQLIAFRAIQGAGAGGLISLAITIIADIVSPRERGRYQGYVGAVFAVSSVVGPLAGGFFVDHLSWRWAFYANLPIGAVAVVITTLTLRIPRPGRSHQIDYLGAALMVAGVSCLLLVTVWGGSEYAWTSPTIILLSGATVVLGALFLAQERRAAEPILPLRLFSNRIFVVSSAGGFLTAMALFAAVVFMPLYLQIVQGVSPTASGLLLAPLVLGLIVSSVAAGRVISRFGRYRLFPVAGTALMSVGMALCTRLDAASSSLASSQAMAVVGLGGGMVMPVLVLAAQNAAEYRDLGTSTSAVAFFRSMGSAFGVALFGSVLNSRLNVHLARLVPAGGNLDVETLRASPEQVQALPPLIRHGVVEAFARSLDTVFTLAVPVAVAAFAVVLFLRQLPLRDTVHVDLGEGTLTGSGLPADG